MLRIDFNRINHAALAAGLATVLQSWLPDGKVIGEELVARNPTRADRRPGSFKINMKSGMWADFATGDRGGDVVSLVSYLDGTNQVAAARHLAEVLSIPAEA